MKILVSIFAFLISINCSAQNLAGNPGFEQFTAYPTGAAQWNLATGWSNCSGNGSPDYAHMLGSGLASLPNNYFATVSPHSGDAIMGFILWHTSYLFREYLSTPLSSPLTIGQTYNVSFYLTNGVHNGNYGGFAVDQVGAVFSTSQLTQNASDNISVTPHFVYPGTFQNSAWQLVSFQFIADSAYQFITFGNFADDLVTDTSYYATSGFPAAYYFIDDVSVELANLTPVAAFSSPNQICPGTCTDFTNLSQNAATFIWSFPGATPSTSTDVNPATICYNSPGNYNVTLIATNATGSDTLTLNNYITVYPYPSPQGILQSGDTLFANQGAISYQWYFNGNIINGATEFFYIASQNGDYNVVATDANGCEVEAAIFDVTTGIFNLPSVNEPLISIFPNPANDILHLIYQPANETAVKVFIYNMLGEEIYSVERALGNGEINVSLLESGCYILEIISSKGSHQLLFLKNKNR